MGIAKIKRTIIMCIINAKGSFVQLFNMKFIARNIRDLWYSRSRNLIHRHPREYENTFYTAACVCGGGIILMLLCDSCMVHARLLSCIMVFWDRRWWHIVLCTIIIYVQYESSLLFLNTTAT